VWTGNAQEARRFAMPAITIPLVVVKLGDQRLFKTPYGLLFDILPAMFLGQFFYGGIGGNVLAEDTVSVKNSCHWVQMLKGGACVSTIESDRDSPGSWSHHIPNLRGQPTSPRFFSAEWLEVGDMVELLLDFIFIDRSADPKNSREVIMTDRAMGFLQPAHLDQILVRGSAILDCKMGFVGTPGTEAELQRRLVRIGCTTVKIYEEVRRAGCLLVAPRLNQR
jgi:hypothetical protein